MCHVGVLAGFTYAHEASADPAVAAYLTSYLDREAAPTLHQAPGLGLEEFKGALLGRWRNAAVADSLDRIRTDSSDRMPAWLVPVAVDNAAAGGPVEASALACAAWARACEGRDDAGRPLPVLDRAADALTAVASRQADDPAAFLRSGLLGQVSQDPRFAEAFLAARRVLVSEGALAAVGRFL
jgi:mannitol 2-dehydrogenase